MAAVKVDKTVHFIRHGQARHNEAMLRLGHDAVYDEAYFDPPYVAVRPPLPFTHPPSSVVHCPAYVAGGARCASSLG